MSCAVDDSCWLLLSHSSGAASTPGAGSASFLGVAELGGASARDQNKFLPPSSSQSKRSGASSTVVLFSLLPGLGLVFSSLFSLVSVLCGVSCDWRSSVPQFSSSSGSVETLTGQEKAFFIRLRWIRERLPFCAPSARRHQYVVSPTLCTTS